MKKFEFRLEQARHIRRIQLDIETARLESHAARIRQIDQLKETLEHEKSDAVVSLQSGGEGTIYGTFGAYSGHVERTRRRLESLRKQAGEELERQRGAVRTARQRLEILEKYRERALDRWTEEYSREQEALAAELFLAATARRMRISRREESGTDRCGEFAATEPLQP